MNNLTLPTSPNVLIVTGKRVKRFGGYGLVILINYFIFRSTKCDLVDQKAHCEIVRYCEELNSKWNCDYLYLEQT